MDAVSCPRRNDRRKRRITRRQALLLSLAAPIASGIALEPMNGEAALIHRVEKIRGHLRGRKEGEKEIRPEAQTRNSSNGAIGRTGTTGPTGATGVTGAARFLGASAGGGGRVAEGGGSSGAAGVAADAVLQPGLPLLLPAGPRQPGADDDRDARGGRAACRRCRSPGRRAFDRLARRRAPGGAARLVCRGVRPGARGGTVVDPDRAQRPDQRHARQPGLVRLHRRPPHTGRRERRRPRLSA